MRNARALGFIFGLCLLLAAIPMLSGSAESRGKFNIAEEVKKARQITRKFAHSLERELELALNTRGVAAAVGAYQAAAPEIASRQSAASGFEVRRTALKLRNPDNHPVDWERKSLEALIAKYKSGADPADLEVYKVVSTKGGDKRFRYIKAIVVENTCLTCHGPNVTRDVSTEIAKYYHDDKSRGFLPGDIIGAYSLEKVID